MKTVKRSLTIILSCLLLILSTISVSFAAQPEAGPAKSLGGKPEVAGGDGGKSASPESVLYGTTVYKEVDTFKDKAGTDSPVTKTNNELYLPSQPCSMITRVDYTSTEYRPIVVGIIGAANHQRSEILCVPVIKNPLPNELNPQQVASLKKQGLIINSDKKAEIQVDNPQSRDYFNFQTKPFFLMHYALENLGGGMSDKALDNLQVLLIDKNFKITRYKLETDYNTLSFSNLRNHKFMKATSMDLVAIYITVNGLTDNVALNFFEKIMSSIGGAALLGAAIAK